MSEQRTPGDWRDILKDMNVETENSGSCEENDSRLPRRQSAPFITLVPDENNPRLVRGICPSKGDFRVRVIHLDSFKESTPEEELQARETLNQLLEDSSPFSALSELIDDRIEAEREYEEARQAAEPDRGESSVWEWTLRPQQEVRVANSNKVQPSREDGLVLELDD